MGAKSVSLPNNEKLIRSRARVADHGEVFTPSWLVEDMLDLVKAETERIDSRFLEPACGSGNFLVPILRRKLASVDLMYGSSEHQRRHRGLHALMSIYGIELLEDNVQECRANLLKLMADHFLLDSDDELHLASSLVLNLNIVHGNALALGGNEGNAIVFSEWNYDGKDHFMREDHLLKLLVVNNSKFSGPKSPDRQLFESSTENDWWVQPIYAPATMSELAEACQH